MTSEAAWPTSEGYSHSHVWVCSSFTTLSDRCSLQCFTVRITKPHVRTNRHKKKRAGTFVIDDLCERKDGQHADPSVPHIGGCGYELLWWLQIYGDALLIAPIGADRGKGGEWGLSHSLAQFISQQDPDMLLYVQNGRDQASRAINLWMITE